MIVWGWNRKLLSIPSRSLLLRKHLPLAPRDLERRLQSTSIFKLQVNSYTRSLSSKRKFPFFNRPRSPAGLTTETTDLSSDEEETKMVVDSSAHRHQPHPILVWVDCEMTGLEIETDQLMEIAVILTDGDLMELETMGPIVIHHDQETMDRMGDWCKKNHKKSGLTKACLASTISITQADIMLLELLNKHGIERGCLAGNSVSYDRTFLAKYCPKFHSLLHYRNMDVSSFKEIIRRWFPDGELYRKKGVHRALDDIRESIAEMKMYRGLYFKESCTLKSDGSKSTQQHDEQEGGSSSSGNSKLPANGAEVSSPVGTSGSLN